MSPRLLLAFAVLALAVAALAAPTPARAQLEVTPFVGALHPVEPVYRDLGAPLIIEMDPGTIYGARVGWWFGPRFGLEGSLAGATTHLRLIGASLLESGGSYMVGEARLRVRMTPEGSAAALDLFGGGAMVRSTFSIDEIFEQDGFEWDSTFGPVLGLGLTANVLQGAGLRFELADYIHDTPFESDEALTGTPSQDRTMHDLTWTVGLVIPIGSR